MLSGMPTRRRQPKKRPAPTPPNVVDAINKITKVLGAFEPDQQRRILRMASTIYAETVTAPTDSGPPSKPVTSSVQDQQTPHYVYIASAPLGAPIK